MEGEEEEVLTHDEWLSWVHQELKPMLSNEKIPVLLYDHTEGINTWFAIQLWAAMLSEKPVVVMVEHGTKLPERLVRAVDLILEKPDDDSQIKERAREALKYMIEGAWPNDEP